MIFCACDFEFQSISSEVKTNGLVEVAGELAWKSSPAWSPDGSKIAFVAKEQFTEIKTIGFSGVEATIKVLSAVQIPSGRYDFSPDGTELVHVSTADNAVWIRDLRMRRRTPGSSSDRVLIGEGNIHDLSWSYNGEWIAYRQNDELWRIAASGGEPEQVHGTPYANSEPVFSPDASLVAFRARKSPRQGIGSALWALDIAKDSLWQITPDELDARSPHWSPDGKKLAFHYSKRDSSVVATVLVTGDSLRRLSSELRSGYTPRWSPDGRKIAFRSLGTQIWLVDPESGDLTQTDGRGSRINWHPGNQAFLTAESGISQNIGVVSLLDSAVVYVTSPENGFTHDYPGWLPDESVIFARKEKTTSIVRLFRATIGEEGRVPLLPEQAYDVIGYNSGDLVPALSPDGQWLLLNSEMTPSANGPGIIYLVSLKDNSVTRITDYLQYNYDLNLTGGAWGPESRSAVFANADYGLSIFSVDTALTIEHLDIKPRSGEPLSDPAWSSHWKDGNSFIAAMSITGLYIMKSDGSEQQRIIQDGGQPAWSPDATRLAFIAANSGNRSRLFVMDIFHEAIH